MRRTVPCPWTRALSSRTPRISVTAEPGTRTELRDCGAAVPLVVCGRNKALAEQLRAAGIKPVYGGADDMPPLMPAAAVLVQTAGGLSPRGASPPGLPGASYGCIPGHGLTNTAA